MYWFPTAAVTNYHKPSSLRRSDFSCLGAGGQKLESKMLVGSFLLAALRGVPSRPPSCSWWLLAFLLCCGLWLHHRHLCLVFLPHLFGSLL